MIVMPDGDMLMEETRKEYFVMVAVLLPMEMPSVRLEIEILCRDKVNRFDDWNLL